MLSNLYSYVGEVLGLNKVTQILVLILGFGLATKSLLMSLARNR